MALTTNGRSLDGAELATTGLAVVVSSALYLRQGESGRLRPHRFRQL